LSEEMEIAGMFGRNVSAGKILVGFLRVLTIPEGWKLSSLLVQC
jgi:hypothetical protein